MKKPRTIIGLLQRIFLCLGVVFLPVAVLCRLDILKPSADSVVQDSKLMGAVFFYVAVGFLAVQTVFLLLDRAMERRYQDLLDDGRKISGTVERVYTLWSVQYGAQRPQRIVYSFLLDGQIRCRKSRLLWKPVGYAAGDSIAVYIDDTGKSAVAI